ncbi:Antitoxin PezA [compost metagenome]
MRCNRLDLLKIVIGKRIKNIRKLHKLNQTEFAKIIGISQGNLSEIESEKILPSLETILRLSQRFKLDLNWLANNASSSTIATHLNEDESTLINLYRQLHEDAKEEVLGFIELKLKRLKK